MSTQEIKVSVCVVTYNQEHYIAQCLQSLVDQETKFNFEVIVSDDCSTDKTPEIIKNFQERYPDIIKPIFHKRNMGAYKNYIFVHGQAKGKYIAHVDGDDYALPGKLQIQSDYLDENLDCNIVWTRMKVLDQKTSCFYEDLLSSEEILTKKFRQEDLLVIGSIACHSSKMYRGEYKLISALNNKFLDFYVDVVQLRSGYSCIINHFLGVYRVGVGISSNSNTKDILIKNLIQLSKEFPEKKSYISALFFKIFLIDLNKKIYNHEVFIYFLRFFSFYTLFYFFKNIKFIKYFRSPV